VILSWLDQIRMLQPVNWGYFVEVEVWV
jgi:acyl-CoA hydrolase